MMYSTKVKYKVVNNWEQVTKSWYKSFHLCNFIIKQSRSPPHIPFHDSTIPPLHAILLGCLRGTCPFQWRFHVHIYICINHEYNISSVYVYSTKKDSTTTPWYNNNPNNHRALHPKKETLYFHHSQTHPQTMGWGAVVHRIAPETSDPSTTLGLLNCYCSQDDLFSCPRTTQYIPPDQPGHYMHYCSCRILV